jgi:hypothetical protein
MEKPPKKPLNKYLKLTGIGLQMGLTIYLAAYFGKKLDVMYPNDRNWFTLGLTMFGVIAAMVSVVMQTKNLND